MYYFVYDVTIKTQTVFEHVYPQQEDLDCLLTAA